MKKTLLLSLTVLAGILNAQTTNNVSINPLIDLKKNSEKYNEKKKEPLDAQLYVNGNMRVQTIDNLDYTADIKKRYKELCWDPATKYVYVKNLDLPYISSYVDYKDKTLDPANYDKGTNAETIDIDPNKFFLFFTNISIKPGKGASDKVVGFKNVTDTSYIPALGFYLGRENHQYQFKSFYRFTKGHHLYYYSNSTIEDPTTENAPIWAATVYAVSNKYMYKLYNTDVDGYTGYWIYHGGGKYGIKLGDLLEGKESNEVKIDNTNDLEINATLTATTN